MAYIGLGSSLLIFIALGIYWIVDYAVPPYPHKIQCTPPPLNGSIYDPALGVDKPFWIDGELQKENLPKANTSFAYCGAPGTTLTPRTILTSVKSIFVLHPFALRLRVEARSIAFLNVQFVLHHFSHSVQLSHRI